MAAFLIIFLILLMLGGNEAMGYYFSRCNGAELFDCLLNRLEEPETEGAVVATGTYSFKGNDVNISANIPLEGGSVTGTVSGTCDGTVRGTYSGGQNGAISGTMSGVCSPFFVNIPASADFTGMVNKDAKTVPFSFSGRGGGLMHDGSMSLTYP